MWKHTRKQIEKMLLSRNMWKSDIANNLMATKPSTASSKECKHEIDLYTRHCDKCHQYVAPECPYNPTPPTSSKECNCPDNVIKASCPVHGIHGSKSRFTDFHLTPPKKKIEKVIWYDDIDGKTTLKDIWEKQCEIIDYLSK